MPKREKTKSQSLRIFLSHSSDDKLAVRELYRRLRQDGFEPWLDEVDILPGQSWQREIIKAIRDVDVVIVCLSSSALNKRGLVQKEISYALEVAEEQPEGAVFLIPLKFEECDVPERLMRWQWVNLFEPDGYDRLIKALKLRASALRKSVLTVRGLENSIELVLEGLSSGKLAIDHALFSNNVADILREFSSLVGLGEVRKEGVNRFATFFLNTGDVFEGLPFPDPVFVLVSHDSEVSRPTIERLQHLLIESNINLGSRIVLLVVFCDPETLGLIKRRISRMFADVYAYDVVVIGHRDLLSIGSANEPKRVLRNFVLSQIDLTTVAPYTITGPTPDNFFFGREHELREITEHASKVSYAIIGGRRIGKTSIMGRLHRTRLPAAGFRTIYYDCSTVVSYESLFGTPIRNWQPGPPNDAPNTFGELLQSSQIDKPLVLLLDEVDKLVPLDRPNNWKLFNALRALTNMGCAQVVLSGERTLRDALHDPTSPLFNFTNEIVLGPLDYRAVEVLITQPMRQLDIELEDPKGIVDLVWSFTSGHPNIVQRLCRRLIKQLKNQKTRSITLDDVNAVIEDSDFQRKDFLETYWEAATHLEKIISLLMANDLGVRTLAGVRHALAKQCSLEPKAREVDEALQRLVDLRSILRRTSGGYEFAVGSFSKVVAGTVTLSDMLEILAEEYRVQTP